MLTTRVDLDISKPLYNKITAKQGDIASRFLEFHLHANGVPFSLENKNVRFHMLKPDGTEIFNDVPKGSDVGVCTLELTSQCLIEPGIGKAELVIYMDGKKLSTIPFKIEIVESVNSEAAELSSNEFSALDKALAKIDNIDTDLNRIDALERQVASWVDYKNNGGNIFGNMTRKWDVMNFTLGKSRFTDKSGFIGIEDTNRNASMGLNFNINPGVSSSITPTANKEVDLGIREYAFKDVWVGSYNEDRHGYTKLPNGFILQWGRYNQYVVPSGTHATEITMPICYPNENLFSCANVNYNFTKEGDSHIEHMNVSVNRVNSDKLKIKVMDVGNLDVESTFEVFWFSIGY